MFISLRNVHVQITDGKLGQREEEKAATSEPAAMPSVADECGTMSFLSENRTLCPYMFQEQKQSMSRK